MYLVSDDNLGLDATRYIVRADLDNEQEDVSLVWVLPTTKLDAMHHTLTHGPCYCSDAENEHNAVAQWLEHNLQNKYLTTEYDDLTLYKSFDLIKT